MPNLFPWLPPALQDLMIDAAWETLVMVFVSIAVAVAIGLPLALLLYSTGQGGLRPNGWINRPLGLLINAVRSTPFIILMVAIVPFTRLVAGTSIGTSAAIVPLAMAATPFISRVYEGALREVEAGLRALRRHWEALRPVLAMRGEAAGAGRAATGRLRELDHDLATLTRRVTALSREQRVAAWATDQSARRLREEIERMQDTLNEFRERVAEAEAEVRAAVAREAVKDRMIADQKAQLEIAHNDVVRLRNERDAAIDKTVQQEGEIRQLKAVIEAKTRVGE